MPKEQFKTNMCGFLNALYFMDMIGSVDYCKVIKHIKKGTMLTAKAMK